MNVFLNPGIATEYDTYYQSEFGSKVDQIEKGVVFDLLQFMERTDMLELGCGTGHWTKFFLDLGFSVHGIDTSEAMLEIAMKKNFSATFEMGDAQRLSCEAHKFSFVSTITMLEFVEDVNQVLSEIYRVLKPGGWFLAGCLNANSILGINKSNSDTFKKARFLTQAEILQKLQLFGEPQIKAGVYLKPDMSLSDGTMNENETEPVFIAALVQKTK